MGEDMNTKGLFRMLSNRCPFTIKVKSWFFDPMSGEDNVTFCPLKNSTVLANYTLKGVKGSIYVFRMEFCCMHTTRAMLLETPQWCF